jgi:SPP1 gp7 family putative phage head morphogenesis protein
MAKREVAICTLDEEDGSEVEVGRLRIQGGVLVADPKDDPMLEGILDEEITVPDAGGEPRTYRASKDPEAFLDALMRHYRSPYLRACVAEPAKKASAAYARTREPNTYEAKVDFARVEQGQDALQTEGKARLMEVLERMREALLGVVGKRLEAGELTPTWVRNLDLKFKGELQRVAREILGEGYRLGSREVRRMLREKRLQIRLVPGLPPEKALAFFEQKAFYITGVLKDRLLSGARNVLYNGIKNGTPSTDVIRELKELFDEYLGDPTAIAQGKEEQAQPYRLETILRTNVNEAYNEGLKDGVDEEVDSGFVIGFLYSAIIDGRQTEVCDFLDGKVLRPDTEDTNALTPSNHFNCRSMLIPITKDEGPVTFITPAQIGRALGLKPKGF